VERASQEFEAAVKRHQVLFPGDVWSIGPERGGGGPRLRWRDGRGLRGFVARLFDG
jgi:hypothetical protein